MFVEILEKWIIAEIIIKSFKDGVLGYIMGYLCDFHANNYMWMTSFYYIKFAKSCLSIFAYGFTYAARDQGRKTVVKSRECSPSVRLNTPRWLPVGHNHYHMLIGWQIIIRHRKKSRTLIHQSISWIPNPWLSIILRLTGCVFASRFLCGRRFSFHLHSPHIYLHRKSPHSGTWHCQHFPWRLYAHHVYSLGGCSYEDPQAMNADMFITGVGSSALEEMS